MRGCRRWACVGAATLALGQLLAVPALAATSGPAPAAVYVVQGLAGDTADVVVDGSPVATAARTASVVGPLRLAAGRHTVAVRTGKGQEAVSSFSVTSGDSVDVIAHWTAMAQPTPRLEVSRNDLSPVGRGKARLVLTHGIFGPPADVRLDGAVLFHDVANGDSLSLLVPARTYGVTAVATVGGSTLLPEVSLRVAAGTLTRVVAVGAPGAGHPDAVVQVLPVPVTGAAVPSAVHTGDGGQAAGLFGPAGPPVQLLPFALVAVLLAAAGAALGAGLSLVPARRPR